MTATPSPKRRITMVEGIAVAFSVGMLCLLAVALWPGGKRGASAGPVIVVAGGSAVSQTATRGSPLPAPGAPPLPAETAPVDQPPIAAPVEELQRRVRNEPRDAAWAGASEQALRTALARSELRALPVVVRCAATLCEVSGVIPIDASEAEQSTAMLALQSEAVTAAISQTGLAAIDSSAIENDPSDPRRVVFRRYFARR